MYLAAALVRNAVADSGYLSTRLGEDAVTYGAASRYSRGLWSVDALTDASTLAIQAPWVAERNSGVNG